MRDDMTALNDIRSLSLTELTELFGNMGLPKYRAKQIYTWLHKRCVISYDEMTDLPKNLRETLSKDYPIRGCEIVRKQVSADDGTVKYLFRLYDGECIESVVMKYKYGYTVCVSSQVGCKMGCAFCASTVAGFVRNLLPGEILSQIYTAQRDLGVRISHIVLMGMGEPMDNYDNVTRFLELVTDENGLNISMRGISLSTCGIVPKIDELCQKHLGLTLSVSLHAPNDKIRNGIMPVNKVYNIDRLMTACRRYTEQTSRRISFEYAMLSGINDSDECACELAQRLKGMLCHVNLIPVNEVEESPFKPSDKKRVEAFAAILQKHSITATVRRKLGSDIDASCGQLRLREQKKASERNENA